MVKPRMYLGRSEKKEDHVCRGPLVREESDWLLSGRLGRLRSLPFLRNAMIRGRYRVDRSHILIQPVGPLP